MEEKEEEEEQEKRVKQHSAWRSRPISFSKHFIVINL